MITEEDYRSSTWSGGKTIELAISPEDSNYAERDFLWRLSSATVDLPESDFTMLPDYMRLITPITGEMILSHDGGAKTAVPVGATYRFDGAWATHSWGCCTDFNLMLRKEKAGGSMMRLRLSAGEERRIQTTQGLCLLYCVKGSVTVKGSEVTASAGEMIQADEQITLKAEEKTVLMSVFVWEKKSSRFF